MSEAGGEAAGGGGRGADTELKTKKPTRQCGELLHLLPFPFLKSLLKLLLLCCQPSPRQVLPNTKHQTLILKTTSPPCISLSKVLTN